MKIFSKGRNNNIRDANIPSPIISSPNLKPNI